MKYVVPQSTQARILEGELSRSLITGIHQKFRIASESGLKHRNLKLS